MRTAAPIVITFFAAREQAPLITFAHYCIDRFMCFGLTIGRNAGFHILEAQGPLAVCVELTPLHSPFSD